jgi:hypothetical protein
MIGSEPFIAAISDQRPLRYGTAPVRKEQLDTTGEPGEKALDAFWWVRSQRTFTGGAGQRIIDSDAPTDAEDRYWDSEGVDVWEPGELSLLHECEVTRPYDTTAGCEIPHGYAIADGDSIRLIRDGQVQSTASGTATVGPGSVVTSMTTDGTHLWWVVSGPSTCSLLRKDLRDDSSTVMQTGSYSGHMVVGYTRGRILASMGPRIHTFTATTPSGNPNPDTGVRVIADDFKWAGFADAPGGIWAFGFSGITSEVHFISLDNSLNLTAPIQMATLPAGEVAQCIGYYLGRIVLGTSAGVRVCEMSGEAVEVGPIVPTSVSGTWALGGYGPYVYAGGTPRHQGALTRIDLSARNESNSRYPYATDIVAPGEATTPGQAVIAVTVRPRAVGFIQEGVGLVQQTDRLVPAGWLESSKVRFGTLEPKRFTYAGVTQANPRGTVLVSTIDVLGDAAPCGEVTSVGAMQDLPVRSGADPVESSAIRLDLLRDSTPQLGPVVTGWRLKALPVPMRSRRIVVSLLCMPQERDSRGMTFRTDTVRRMQAITLMEEAGAPILIRRFSGGRVVWQAEAVINAIELERVTPFDWTDAEMGGVLTVELRTVPQVVGSSPSVTARSHGVLGDADR